MATFRRQVYRKRRKRGVGKYLSRSWEEYFLPNRKPREIGYQSYTTVSSDGWSSVQRLAFGMIKQAWRDLDYPDHDKEAIDYMFQDWNPSPFSFQRCCELLGQNHKLVRARLLTAYLTS